MILIFVASKAIQTKLPCMEYGYDQFTFKMSIRELNFKKSVTNVTNKWAKYIWSVRIYCSNTRPEEILEGYRVNECPKF